MIFGRFTSWGRHRGVRARLVAAALAAVLGGWVWTDFLIQPKWFEWIRTARNDAGEPVRMLHLFKQSPAPMESLIGGINGWTTLTVPSLAQLGESYSARWVVNGRDLYVVDDIPLRSLLPANTWDIAGRGKGGSLLTRMTVMPAGRLRFSWILCPDRSCERPYMRDGDFQGSAEFQGRLEATARYPADD